MKILEKNKNKIISISFVIFLLPIFFLLLIKIYTLFNSYDLYVTSGAEITTLNFIQNFLSGNNLLTNGDQDILYEFYGLNFHLIYWPLIKFFQLFGISYLLSARLITLAFLFLLTFIIILIFKRLSKKNFIFKDNPLFLGLIIFTFLVNHQASSWWILTYRPDIIAILFSLISIYFFLIFIENENDYIFCLSLIFCILSWSLKQNFLFVMSSIFFYHLIKKKYYYLFLQISFSFFILYTFNFLTEYNNFDLLNRSPGVVLSQLEFRNYYDVLIQYLIKNPYLIIFVTILILTFNKSINKKMIFFYLLVFFLFLQSSFVSVLHGAGFNHLMSFSFFMIISMCLVNFNFCKKYFLLISFLLIISSIINCFQLANYNKFGRQGLYFDNQEKKQLREFKSFIENRISKPAIIIGASNRTEMFLSEDLLGKDSFQLVSFIDNSWRKWLFRSNEEMKENEKIFKEKFKNIKTVLILEKKNTKKYIDHNKNIKKKNFLIFEKITF